MNRYRYPSKSGNPFLKMVWATKFGFISTDKHPAHREHLILQHDTSCSNHLYLRLPYILSLHL